MKTQNEKLPKFWQENASIWPLVFYAAASLFFMLGAKSIWTQESRWAEISSMMLIKKDFFHPYLYNQAYYDKPLLSYWLIILSSFITGGIGHWALRLPSAIAGLVTVGTVFSTARNLFDRRTALASAWMLASTYYFVFWSRVGCADMLNAAGISMAIWWYLKPDEKHGFRYHLVFMLIIALTCLMKGLTGLAVPIVFLFPWFLFKGYWKKHLKLSVIPAALVAMAVYIAPFVISSLTKNQNYADSGLYLVFRENIMRFFQPFDHQGHWFTYILYLPLYTLPWSLFLPAAIYSAFKNRANLEKNTILLAASCIVVFLFFSVSGSRRSYYILPLVPFVIMFIAQRAICIADSSASFSKSLKVFFGIFATLGVLWFALFQPAFELSGQGVRGFAAQLKTQAQQYRPWQEWNFVLLHADQNTSFYLDAYPKTHKYSFTQENMVNVPQSVKDKADTILITRNQNAQVVAKTLPEHTQVREKPKGLMSWFYKGSPDPKTSVAFIPAHLNKTGLKDIKNEN